jgi:hypothetical protein
MKKPASPLSVAAKEKVLQILAEEPSPQALNAALRHLAKWRAKLLENTLVAQEGTTIKSGPFAGMIYNVVASEGCRVPRLLGCYEKTLGPIIETIIGAAPPLIIDIGCAEGYYAVGLARRLPNTIVWARDADKIAREKCVALAATNDVGGRVKVGGQLTHADFDICRAQDTTIICDIEGAEDGLLDPQLAKGLRRADILVEVHENVHPNLTTHIAERFEETHQISVIQRSFSSDALPDWMDGLSDMDRLISLWEWRAGPTPWLWMQRKAA